MDIGFVGGMNVPGGFVPGLVEIRVVPPYCSVDPGKDLRSNTEDTTHDEGTNISGDAPVGDAPCV